MRVELKNWRIFFVHTVSDNDIMFLFLTILIA